MINTRIAVSETLGTAFELWKKNFVPIALTLVIVFIPVQILIELTAQAFEASRDPNTIVTADEWQGLRIESQLYNLIRQLIGVIATLGIYNFTFSLYREGSDDRDAPEIVRFGVKKWPENFINTLVAGLITLAFTLLLIIPGIYKAVQYSFVSPLVADGEEEPLEKSKALVKEKWFDIFGMVLLIFLIAFAIELIIAVPFVALPENTIIAFLFRIASAVATSYTTVVFAVYYLRLKELKQKMKESELLYDQA